jgi:hypothetical protein
MSDNLPVVRHAGPEPEPRPDGEGQAGAVGRLDQLDLAAEDRGQELGLAGQGRRIGQGGRLPGGSGRIAGADHLDTEAAQVGGRSGGRTLDAAAVQDRDRRGDQ